MIDYDEAVQLHSDAEVLLGDVRAYESKCASEETREEKKEDEKSDETSERTREALSSWLPAEMVAEGIASMRTKKARVRDEKAKMRAEIDKALDELKESVDELRDTLEKERRDTLASKARFQTLIDVFKGIEAAYRVACNVVGDFEKGLRTRQCVARARALLAERKIPRSIRLKTLV
jgi:hypothetical protein